MWHLKNQGQSLNLHSPPSCCFACCPRIGCNHWPRQWGRHVLNKAFAMGVNVISSDGRLVSDSQHVGTVGKVGPFGCINRGSCHAWNGFLMRFKLFFGCIASWTWKTIALELEIDFLSTMFTSTSEVPPRKPAAHSKLPAKGKLVTKPMVLKSFGTISHELRFPETKKTNLFTGLGSGLFGSTVQANPNFLSKRGAGVPISFGAGAGCHNIFILCQSNYLSIRIGCWGLCQSDLLVEKVHGCMQSKKHPKRHLLSPIYWWAFVRLGAQSYKS